MEPLDKFISLKEKTVLSSTGQVRLDFGRGLLAVDAPRAQVVCGNLEAGPVKLGQLEVASDLRQLYVALVPMDGRPLAESGSMLLQVMTEEKPAGFTTEPAGEGLRRITSLGHNPWLIREPRGEIRLKRAVGGGRLTVTPLDDNGIPQGDPQKLDAQGGFGLRPEAVYYWIRE